MIEAADCMAISELTLSEGYELRWPQATAPTKMANAQTMMATMMTDSTGMRTSVMPAKAAVDAGSARRPPTSLIQVNGGDVGAATPADALRRQLSYALPDEPR